MPVGRGAGEIPALALSFRRLLFWQLVLAFELNRIAAVGVKRCRECTLSLDSFEFASPSAVGPCSVGAGRLAILYGGCAFVAREDFVAALGRGRS